VQPIMAGVSTWPRSSRTALRPRTEARVTRSSSPTASVIGVCRAGRDRSGSRIEVTGLPRFAPASFEVNRRYSKHAVGAARIREADLIARLQCLQPRAGTGSDASAGVGVGRGVSCANSHTRAGSRTRPYASRRGLNFKTAGPGAMALARPCCSRAAYTHDNMNGFASIVPPEPGLAPRSSANGRNMSRARGKSRAITCGARCSGCDWVGRADGLGSAAGMQVELKALHAAPRPDRCGVLPSH
jgi:hypothetical protein